jgi:predicted dithiol-disulfide oxidoreductase (DUF899 family)
VPASTRRPSLPSALLPAGTREEWSAARKALLEREQEVAGVDVVYHTYARTAPDRFLLAPYYYQLLDQIPNGRDADFPLRRHDEY